MITSAGYSLKVAQAARGGKIEESIERIIEQNLKPQDTTALQRKIKNFSIITVLLLVMLLLATFMRYKVTETSIQKELQIVNMFMKQKNTQKASATDQLSWNYAKAIDMLKN